MDNDTPNINDASHDNQEWWNAKRTEIEAEMEKMDAKERMAANDAFQDFSAEVDAAADWTEAQWDQFKAKVSQWWNKGETTTDEAI